MATTTERLAIIVTADSRQAVQGLQAVGKSASTDLAAAEKSAVQFGESLTRIGTIATGAGVAISAGVYKSVQAASDLGESANKAKVIFGSAFGDIDKYASGAAESIGQSKRAALDATSTFATFGKSAGLTGTDLSKFSTDLTTLSSDLASFYNTSPEDAVTALGAALRGENEPIRRFGVLLDDATLRKAAFDQGLTTDVKSALTPQQKALAAYAEILKQTGDAQGDYQRTADSLPNKVRAMQASWEDAKASFGEAALPALTGLATTASGLLKTFNELDPSTKKYVGTVGALAGVTLTVAGPVLQLVGAYKQLAAAKAAAAAADAGAGGGGVKGAAAVGGVFALGAALQVGLDGKVAGEVAANIDKATVSAERLSKAIASNDMAALEAESRRAKQAVDALTDPGPWETLKRSIQDAAAGTSALGGNAALPSIFEAMFGNEDTNKQVDAFNASVDRFKTTLSGLDPEQARAAIDAFIKGQQGGIVPASELAKLQKILNDEYAKTAPPTDKTAEYTGALKDATGAAGDLRSLLEGAGLSTDQVESALGAVDKGATGAKVSLSDLRGIAKSLGIDIDQLAQILSGAGVEIDSFSSRFEKAAAAGRKASSMVIDDERAQMRKKSALEALDGFAEKQAREQADANQRVMDATDGVTDAIKRRAKAQRDLDALSKKSAIAGSVPLLQEITRFAADQQKAAEAAAQAAEIAYGKDSPQAVAARRGVDAANQRRQQAGGFLNAALGEQKGRNAQEIADAQDAVKSADRDVSRASRARADAERDAAEVAKSAGDKYKAVLLDAAEATINAKEAHDRLIAAYADGLDPIGQFRSQLEDAAAQGQITAGQLGEFNKMLGDTSTALATSIMWAAVMTAANAPTPVAQLPRVEGIPAYQVSGAQGAAPTSTVNNTYNINATAPAATAAEIARREKQKLLEQKLGR